MPASSSELKEAEKRAPKGMAAALTAEDKTVPVEYVTCVICHVAANGIRHPNWPENFGLGDDELDPGNWLPQPCEPAAAYTLKYSSNSGGNLSSHLKIHHPAEYKLVIAAHDDLQARTTGSAPSRATQSSGGCPPGKHTDAEQVSLSSC